MQVIINISKISARLNVPQSFSHQFLLFLGHLDGQQSPDFAQTKPHGRHILPRYAANDIRLLHGGHQFACRVVLTQKQATRQTIYKCA